MSREIEVVAYEKLRHVKVFVNRITYRNYHQHGAFEFLLVLEGRGQLNLRDGTVPLSPGTLAILNPQQPHEIDAEGGAVLVLILQISPHFCQEYLPVIRNLQFDCPDAGTVLPTERLQALRKSLCEIALQYLRAEQTYTLRCVGSLANLLADLMEELPHRVLSERDRNVLNKRTRRVLRLTDYLEEHYLSPVRLSDLASTEGLTPTHVSHLFTDYYGISFQEYLSNLRFEKAMSYLRTSELSQVEVAAASGFSDPKYLSKAMEKRLGCTLGDYRASLRAIPMVSTQAGPGAPLEFVLSEEESIKPITRFLHTIAQ